MTDRLELIARIGAALGTADPVTQAVLRDALAAIVEDHGVIQARERRKAKDRIRKRSTHSVDSSDSVDSVESVESVEGSPSPAPSPAPSLLSPEPPNNPSPPPTPPSPSPRRAEVDRVVQHYRARHPARRPGEKDRKLITRQLGTYTADELCEAIDGNAADDWAQRTGKHELSWILRDNGQIDTYRAKAAQPESEKHAPVARAATLWARYKAANLLTKWERPEYERIGAVLVAQGDYPSVDAFLAELRLTKPWTLKDARTDGYAINELATRLSSAEPQLHAVAS